MFDNSDGSYTPGLYARLKLVGSGTYNAMLINDEAVGTDLGKKFVIVMDGDKFLGLITRYDMLTYLRRRAM